MKKTLSKYTLIIAGLALLLPVIIFGVSTPNPQLDISLSETEMNIEQLKDVSDIVVIAELKSIKEKLVKTIVTSPDDLESAAAKDNKKITIKAPVIIYNLKITEIIKGEVKLKNIDLIIPDVNIEGFGGLEEGTVYKFYLEKNDFYGKNAYNLASFNQGFEEIK